MTAIGGAELQNVKVTIDGIAINAASLGIRRLIDPGQHVLTASADGYKPAATSLKRRRVSICRSSSGIRYTG